MRTFLPQTTLYFPANREGFFWRNIMATSIVDIDQTTISAGQMSEFWRLVPVPGSHVNGKTMQAYIERRNPFESKKKENKILRLISGGHNLVLDPTDGTEVLADAENLFTGYISPNFKDKNWDANGPSQPTQEMPVEVYEIKENSDFMDMFGFLLPGGKSFMRQSPRYALPLCLTQSQIIGFVRKYRNWLRTNGYKTFFLFQSHGNFFVARVYVNSAGSLSVLVRRFEDLNVWYAENRHRVVVPKLVLHSVS